MMDVTFVISTSRDLYRYAKRNTDGKLLAEGLTPDLEEVLDVVRSGFKGDANEPRAFDAPGDQVASLNAEIDRLKRWLKAIEQAGLERGERDVAWAAACALMGADHVFVPHQPPPAKEPARDPDSAVQVRFSTEQAETYDAALSDLLCWAAGFAAALGNDDLSRAPMGIPTIRNLRLHLNRAQRAAEGTSK